MTKVTAAAAALAAVLIAGAQPASAQRDGPWCAHISIGNESMTERCDMRSFEMCLAEIRGQGSSHCAPNPRYRGQQDPRREPRRQQRESR